MKARERILARVRRALAGRPEAALPPVPEGPALSREEAFSLFKARLSAAGARVERLSSLEEARAFLKEAEAGAKTAWVSPLVPAPLRPELPEAPPEEAELGVSRATAGVAETGSVVLSSREGRRGQLLVPRHLVWLFEDDLYGTLLEALRAVRGEDASALALHSGPSKSADIGQIMVKGVHGPGELWVGVLSLKIGKEVVESTEGRVLRSSEEGGVMPAEKLKKQLESLVFGQAVLKTIDKGRKFRLVGISESGDTLYLQPERSENVYGLPFQYLVVAAQLLPEIGLSALNTSKADQILAEHLGIKSTHRASYILAILRELGYL